MYFVMDSFLSTTLSNSDDTDTFFEKWNISFDKFSSNITFLEKASTSLNSKILNWKFVRIYLMNYLALYY